MAGVFMELIKKQIHMNQWKGNVATQITLDDDFIVPDTMDDMEQVMLDNGEIQAEQVKPMGDKVNVKGRLEFQVLYRREGGGLQTLGGSIPFEEMINVPQLEDKDTVSLSWTLDDLNTNMIHSRKLGVQAIVTLQVRIEASKDTEAAVDVKQGGTDTEAYTGAAENHGEMPVEILKRRMTAASMAVCRKDTYRIREAVGLTGGKPGIGRLLWKEMKLRAVSVKPLDGTLHLEGELTVFVIYEAEDDTMPVQWLEETIPFSGEMEAEGVKEDQIPMITVRLSHREIEAKPDYDGEMRELEIDGVLELDIRLYEELETELLSDVYSNSRELTPERRETVFDRILTRNVCRSRIGEKVKLPQGERILQICHHSGTIKLDEVEPGEDCLKIEGVLEVTLLYLTSDDQAPVQPTVEQIPFKCTAEARGIREDSVYQLDAGLEQLTAVMMGGDMVEIKAVAVLDFLVLQPVKEQVITGISSGPLDLKKLQELPGIAGYIVQPGDSLWMIAKKFHTTISHIISANELADEEIKAGQRLLLVKEVARG